MPRKSTSSTEQTGPTVTTTLEMPTTATQQPEEKQEKSPTWFWDMLQEIPKDKWGATYDVMGWRVDPKPGQVAGAKGFLFQVFEPITPMWIKANYGGGKFRCILEKNSRFQTSHEFEIEGQPRYDLTREAPNVPAGSANGNNDTALLRILEQQISKLNDQLAVAQQRGENNPALAETVSILSTGYREAITAVKNQIPGSGDQTAQLTALLGAAEKIANMRNGGNGSGNAMMDTFLKVAMDKLLTPVNPLEQLTQLAGLIDVVEKIRGGGAGGGEPKDWKAMLVQHMPEVLSTVKEVFTPQPAAVPQRPGQPAARPQQQQTPQQPAARPQQPGQAQQPAQPAAAASAVQSTGPLQTVRRTDTVATPEEVAAAQIQEATVENPGTQEQYDEALKVQIVNLIRMGASGETIADLLEDCKPQLREELGKYAPEMITQFFAADPILKLAVEDPRWQQVLAAARAYILEDIEA